MTAYHISNSNFMPGLHQIPEGINRQFVKGMVGWFSEVMLLKVSVPSPGGGEALLLDMVKLLCRGRSHRAMHTI